MTGPDQFKKKPRQKTPRGKRVVMSPEAKAEYVKLMEAKDERDRTYTRHLPSADNKARR